MLGLNVWEMVHDMASHPGLIPARSRFLVTAHYDHIGVISDGKGDLICNGANDNASGTAAVMEVAAALAGLRNKPERSIMFATFFGEERGKMGSRHYSRNPSFPLERTVANINLEQIRTAVWKSPLTGRRIVRKLDIDGDAQADLAGHGGEHRAVFVYQMASYHYWERFLGRDDFIFGQFGENFTVEGLPDNEVCIGDRYRIGDAIFEVTQPRVTCYRVGIRMNEPRMAALRVAHHRPGFYFRVLQEGEVGAGDDIAKVADGPERITVADVDALLYLPGPLSYLHDWSDWRIDYLQP